MTKVRTDGTSANVVAMIGSQPIVLAAAALMILVLGIGSIALWRAYSGTSPEQERTASARLLQTRTAQAWSYVVAACVLGLLFFVAAVLVERLAMPWRAQQLAAAAS